MQYIYRGNYGLISKSEIMAAGESAENADLIMDMKSKFAFGHIRETEELLDSQIIDAMPREIRNGVMVNRIETNIGAVPDNTFWCYEGRHEKEPVKQRETGSPD